jgi:hypothetical protein
LIKHIIALEDSYMSGRAVCGLALCFYEGAETLKSVVPLFRDFIEIAASIGKPPGL